jgi:hypothetical protein
MMMLTWVLLRRKDPAIGLLSRLCFVPINHNVRPNVVLADKNESVSAGRFRSTIYRQQTVLIQLEFG